MFKSDDKPDYEELGGTDGLTPELKEAVEKDPSLLDRLRPAEMTAFLRGFLTGELTDVSEGSRALLRAFSREKEGTLAQVFSLRGPTPDYAETALAKMSLDTNRLWAEAEPEMSGLLDPGRLQGDTSSGAGMEREVLTRENFASRQGRIMMHKAYRTAIAEEPNEPVGYLLGNVKTGEINMVTVAPAVADELASMPYEDLHAPEDEMMEWLTTHASADPSTQQVISAARLHRLLQADAWKAASKAGLRRMADEVSAAPLPATTLHATAPNPLADAAAAARVGDALNEHLLGETSSEEPESLRLAGAQISAAFTSPARAAPGAPQTASDRLAALRARTKPAEQALAAMPTHVPAFRLHTTKAAYEDATSPMKFESAMAPLTARVGPARAQRIEDEMMRAVEGGLKRLSLSTAGMEAFKNGHYRGNGFMLRPFYVDEAAGADMERGFTLHGPNAAGERTMQSLTHPLHFGYQFWPTEGTAVRVGNGLKDVPTGSPLTFHAYLVPGGASSSLLIGTPMDFERKPSGSFVQHSHLTAPGTDASGLMTTVSHNQKSGSEHFSGQASVMVMDQ